ncbi:MAG: hypothetical protein HF973_04595 [Chloroflexi bacterium]|nr:hypothetical protein [Chloroflexota bacterium]
MITKTAYLAYPRCPKAFWLDAHQPDLAAPPDPSRQRRLRAGQEVGYWLGSNSLAPVLSHVEAVVSSPILSSPATGYGFAHMNAAS